MLRRRSTLHLGIAVGQRGLIPADRIAMAQAAARRMRQGIEESRPDRVVAMATAALRDAGNGPEVVDRISRCLGVPVAVLDGAEEARLCMLGQGASVWTPDDPWLGVDLGGGSLEVAVASGPSVLVGLSLPLGPARLSGEMVLGDPISSAERDRLFGRVFDEVKTMAVPLRGYGELARRTVVSGGTARALARLASGGTGPSARRGVNQVELPVGQVRDLADRISRLDLDGRRGLPGIPARRAALLGVGAVVLDALGAALGAERFVVSEWGLREGAMVDVLARELG